MSARRRKRTTAVSSLRRRPVIPKSMLVRTRSPSGSGPATSPGRVGLEGYPRPRVFLSAATDTETKSIRDSSLSLLGFFFLCRNQHSSQRKRRSLAHVIPETERTALDVFPKMAVVSAVLHVAPCSTGESEDACSDKDSRLK